MCHGGNGLNALKHKEKSMNLSVVLMHKGIMLVKLFGYKQKYMSAKCVWDVNFFHSLHAVWEPFESDCVSFCVINGNEIGI